MHLSEIAMFDISRPVVAGSEFLMVKLPYSLILVQIGVDYAFLYAIRRVGRCEKQCKSLYEIDIVLWDHAFCCTKSQHP